MAPGIRLPSTETTRPVITHGVPVPTRSMLSPSERTGDSTTWNGPSTVDSVATPNFLLLIVSVSIDMPEHVRQQDELLALVVALAARPG